MKIMKVAAVLLLLVSTVGASADSSVRVVTIAGTPGEAGLRDGDRRSVLFDRPTWIEEDYDGRLYVVDRNNDAIRVIDLFDVRTLTVFRRDDRLEEITFDFGPAFGGGIATEPRLGGCGGLRYGPAIFVASTGTHQVEMVVDNAWFSGAFSGAFLAARDGAGVEVGVRGEAGARDGHANAVGEDDLALLTEPGDITFSLNYFGRADSNDLVYIVDTGNHTIRRVNFGVSMGGCHGLNDVDTLAGKAREPGYADGTGSVARFNTPRGIATAPDGSLYVSDSGNHVIRRITPEGVVSRVAGQPGIAGHRDGAALNAQLNMPSGLAFTAAGELIIADTANHCIRKLTPDGALLTIAGTPGVGGYQDGDPATARFAGPVGVAITPGGIVVADTSNNVIRRIGPVSSRRRAVQPLH